MEINQVILDPLRMAYIMDAKGKLEAAIKIDQEMYRAYGEGDSAACTTLLRIVAELDVIG